MKAAIASKAALLLLAIPAAAQVAIVCAPSPVAYSRAVFDRRSAGAVVHWSCVLTNGSPSAATVSEAAIQGWMMKQGISALSSQAIRTGATEIKRRGRWATMGRVLSYSGMLTAALAASEIIAIGPAWGAVAGFASLQLPTLGSMIAARDPDDSIFEALAIADDLALPPGQSVSVAMFAAPLADARPVHGELEILVTAPPPPMALPGPDNGGITFEPTYDPQIETYGDSWRAVDLWRGQAPAQKLAGFQLTAYERELLSR